MTTHEQIAAFKNKVAQKLGYRNFDDLQKIFESTNTVKINCFNTHTFEILIFDSSLNNIAKLFGYPNLDVLYNTWKTLINVRCYKALIGVKFKFTLN